MNRSVVDVFSSNYSNSNVVLVWMEMLAVNSRMVVRYSVIQSVIQSDIQSLHFATIESRFCQGARSLGVVPGVNKKMAER